MQSDDDADRDASIKIIPTFVWVQYQLCRRIIVFELKEHLPKHKFGNWFEWNILTYKKCFNVPYNQCLQFLVASAFSTPMRVLCGWFFVSLLVGVRKQVWHDSTWGLKQLSTRSPRKNMFSEKPRRVFVASLDGSEAFDNSSQPISRMHDLPQTWHQNEFACFLWILWFINWRKSWWFHAMTKKHTILLSAMEFAICWTDMSVLFAESLSRLLILRLETIICKILAGPASMQSRLRVVILCHWTLFSPHMVQSSKKYMKLQITRDQLTIIKFVVPVVHQDCAKRRWPKRTSCLHAPLVWRRSLSQTAIFFGTESASNIRADSDMWYSACQPYELTSMCAQLTGCKWRKIFAPRLNFKALLQSYTTESLRAVGCPCGRFYWDICENFGTKATGERFVSHPNDFLQVVPFEFLLFSS